MKPLFFIVLLCVTLLGSCKENDKNNLKVENPIRLEEKTESISKGFFIEILDEEALKILDEDAEIKILAGGFKWVEGPLWVEDGSFLLFSDVVENTVYKLDNKNEVSTFLKPSGYTGKGTYSDEPGSNGLLLNAEGELILMQHGDRRVAKMKGPLNNPNPDFETLIGNFGSKKFNSPNDGFFDKDGNLYFTDPPYGLPLRMEDTSKELDFQGVYCLLKTGELKVLDKLSRPNGLSQSPDGKTLYVAVSDAKHAVWYAYDIIEPGVITNKKIFYNVTELIDQENPHGLPDGMKVNSNGYIFASGPDGIWVFNSTTKLIARIHTGLSTSNCAFNTDESTLYVTADDYVLKVHLK